MRQPEQPLHVSRQPAPEEASPSLPGCVGHQDLGGTKLLLQKVQVQAAVCSHPVTSRRPALGGSLHMPHGEGILKRWPCARVLADTQCNVQAMLTSIKRGTLSSIYSRQKRS